MNNIDTKIKSQKKDIRSIVSSSSSVFFIVYIVSSIRGIHINISDYNGKVLSTFSTGRLGLKKKDRYQFTSVYKMVQEVLIDLKNLKTDLLNDFNQKGNQSPIQCKYVIFLKGFGFKRNRVARILVTRLKPICVTDLSGLPHNGCRPKKLRRK